MLRLPIEAIRLVQYWVIGVYPAAWLACLYVLHISFDQPCFGFLLNQSFQIHQPPFLNYLLLHIFQNPTPTSTSEKQQQCSYYIFWCGPKPLIYITLFWVPPKPGNCLYVDSRFIFPLHHHRIQDIHKANHPKIHLGSVDFVDYPDLHIRNMEY